MIIRMTEDHGRFDRYNIVDEADLASAWHCASTANIGTPQATPAAVSSSEA